MSIHIREPEQEHAHVPAQPALSTKTRGRGVRRLMVALLLVSCLLTLGYAGVSTYIATQLAYVPQKALVGTPANFGLAFKEVTFPAREDGVRLKGWFIPGVLPDGRLTADRTLVVVHGMRTNRTDPAAGLLDLTAAFARQGYAVLAFDMRGNGESPPAPLTIGIYEQRDVLGAVDFLRSGTLPYPELGRPRLIAGYGVSLGGASLIYAAAKEPAIRAVVSDSAGANYAANFERDVPLKSGLPSVFTPGALAMVAVLYGANFYGERPVDVVARIAPRPIFLIHGAADTGVPPSNMDQLYAAATSVPNAHVEKLLVPGAKHAQSFHVMGAAYVTRVVAFYTAALGPDQSASR